MKAVLQRVLSASVEVNQQVIASIDKGYLIYLGIATDDTEADMQALAKKVSQLRLMATEEKAFHEDIVAHEGSFLVVSQFTLLANTQKGRRPSFSEAARPEVAKSLYELFVQHLRTLSGLTVETGQFQADMKVYSCNDGPVTILLDR